MSATQTQETSNLQTIINVLGTQGPLSGTDLVGASGLPVDVVKAEVRALKEEHGIVTQDGSYFDVIEAYRAPGRDEQGNEPVIVQDEFTQAPPATTAPAKPQAPAKPKAAPAKPKAAPAKPAPVAPKAPAPVAAGYEGVNQAEMQRQALEYLESNRGKALQAQPNLYYTDPMDALTVEELIERVEMALAGAELNADEGSRENALLADTLERWAKRGLRRLRTISRGKGHGVRAKGKGAVSTDEE